MAYCYCCGKSISNGQAYRRLVPTGSGNFGKSVKSVRVRCAKRTVCYDCSLLVDKQERGGFIFLIAIVIIVVTIGFIVYNSTKH